MCVCVSESAMGDRQSGTERSGNHKQINPERSRLGVRGLPPGRGTGTGSAAARGHAGCTLEGGSGPLPGLPRLRPWEGQGQRLGAQKGCFPSLCPAPRTEKTTDHVATRRPNRPCSPAAHCPVQAQPDEPSDHSPLATRSLHSTAPITGGQAARSVPPLGPAPVPGGQQPHPRLPSGLQLAQLLTTAFLGPGLPQWR